MHLSGKRVVLIEDEAITVMYLCHLFQQAGMFMVGTATTGEQAVQIVLAEKPDLVIVDIKLPTFDGLDALEQIQAQNPVCAVVLSAYGDRSHREQARNAGVCAYLVKPLDGPAILRHLEEAYNVYEAQQASPHAATYALDSSLI